MIKKVLILTIYIFSILSAQAQNSLRKGNNLQGQRYGKQGDKKGGEERKKRVFDIAQTISQGAQINTIAFSALAFYTGSVYSSSFYPPGKVADFFGFQYMRDNDLSESGHNTDFLTKAAWHTMQILNSEQMQLLIDLAINQEKLFNKYALGRLVLIDAFHRNLNGDIPKGSKGLDIDKVKKVSRDLYLIDAEISYGRALAFAKVINSLSPDQITTLQKMGKEGMQTWTMPEKPKIKIPRGLNVWVMSNASEMFSWYLRGLDADIYFCPERQGTYFGGFFMKDAPAVGNAGYAIDPQATSRKGSAMLNNILTPSQAEKIREIYPKISASLNEIVKVRQDISKELRKALDGDVPDKERVMSLCGIYGELDAEYIFVMAETFAQIGKTLNQQQREDMFALRDLDDYPDKDGKVFLYSREIDIPQIPNTNFLFK